MFHWHYVEEDADDFSFLGLKKVMTSYVDQNNLIFVRIGIMDSPPGSSGLNPIEYTWDMLGRQLPDNPNRLKKCEK